jgi:ABC-type maltose transport system permease subunit
VLARVLLHPTRVHPGGGFWLFISGKYEKWVCSPPGADGRTPIMLLYMLMQDHIVGGLTQGAIKG